MAQTQARWRAGRSLQLPVKILPCSSSLRKFQVRPTSVAAELCEALGSLGLGLAGAIEPLGFAGAIEIAAKAWSASLLKLAARAWSGAARVLGIATRVCSASRLPLRGHNRCSGLLGRPRRGLNSPASAYQDEALRKMSFRQFCIEIATRSEHLAQFVCALTFARTTGPTMRNDACLKTRPVRLGRIYRKTKTKIYVK